MDDSDMSLVDQIREHRNLLAHDLPKFLGTPDAEINIQLLGEISALVAKIDRWWIREVELNTDPDFDGREVADEEIISGNRLTIHLMLRIATGEDSAAFWGEFQKRAADALPPNPHRGRPVDSVEPPPPSATGGE